MLVVIIKQKFMKMVCISQRITLAIIFRSCVDYNEVLFFEYILRSFQLLWKRDLNMKPQYQIKSFHNIFLFWNWHYSLLSFFVKTCCYRNINMKNCSTVSHGFLCFGYMCSKKANVKKKCWLMTSWPISYQEFLFVYAYCVFYLVPDCDAWSVSCEFFLWL